MAYSHGGAIQWGTNGAWKDNPSDSAVYWIGSTTIINDNYGLAIKLDNDKYYVYAKPLNSGVAGKNLKFLYHQ